MAVDTNVEAADRSVCATVAGRGLTGIGGPQGHRDSLTVVAQQHVFRESEKSLHELRAGTTSAALFIELNARVNQVCGQVGIEFKSRPRGFVESGHTKKRFCVSGQGEACQQVRSCVEDDAGDGRLEGGSRI